MPNERFPLDLVLSKEDFDECGWENIVENCKEKDIQNFSTAFIRAAKNHDLYLTHFNDFLLTY